MSVAIRLATGAYPHTQGLINGTIGSKQFHFEHTASRPAHASFRTFVNDVTSFDVSELAVVTYLVARELGRPLVLLPVVLMCQPEVPLLVCREDSPLHGVEDLVGVRVGVRSYSQTTATWVRGILQDLYDLEPADLRWSAFDAGHVDGYTDPAEVERMPADRNLLDCVASGELDAAIVSWEQRITPGLRPLLDDAEAIERTWREKRGITPINHVVCANADVLRSHAGLAEALVALFKDAREASEGSHDPGIDPGPWGFEANVPAFETLADYAYRQGITTRRLGLDELFAL